MPHAYTEDQLVEQPVIGLFAALGWATASALERVELAFVSADGALSNQPGQRPRSCVGKQNEG